MSGTSEPDHLTIRLAGFRSRQKSCFCSVHSLGVEDFEKEFLSPRGSALGNSRREAGNPEEYLCHCHPWWLEFSLDTEADEAPALHVAQMFFGGRNNWSSMKAPRQGLHSVEIHLFSRPPSEEEESTKISKSWNISHRRVLHAWGWTESMTAW